MCFSSGGEGDLDYLQDQPIEIEPELITQAKAEKQQKNEQKMQKVKKHTRNEWNFCGVFIKNTLETSVIFRPTEVKYQHLSPRSGMAVIEKSTGILAKTKVQITLDTGWMFK